MRELFFKRVRISHSDSFVLPLVLSNFNLSETVGPPEIPVITSYYLAVFLLSLISLLCFMNVLGYFLSIHLLNRYDIENKFPKLKKIIKYYEKGGLFWVIVESLMCILTLLFLTVTALILYFQNLV